MAHLQTALNKKSNFPHTHASSESLWGGINGTLSDQADLQSALNAKSDTHTHPYAYDNHNHGLTYEANNANIQEHVAQAHAPSVAQANADITKAEIEAKLVGAITSHSHSGGAGEAFPVGSVFISVVSTNPATLLGYGTWGAIAAGRVLVGLDSGDTDFDTVEETGGAKTVTLDTTMIPAHTHVQNAHTHTQDAHAHTQASQTATAGSISSWEHGAIDTSSAATETLNTGNATAVNQNATATNQDTGGGAAHSNVQPYFVVYMFKRTA